MKNLVVADTLFHANTMIRWLKLDTAVWQPKAYGSGFAGPVMDVILINPARGVQQEHINWIVEKLLTNVASGGRIMDVTQDVFEAKDFIAAHDGPIMAAVDWEDFH